MTFSTREKKMLYLLALVLVAALGLLVLQRLSAVGEEKQTTLTGLQSLSAEMSGALASLDTLRSSIPVIEEETEAAKARFRIYGGTTAADDVITDTALACSISPLTLELSDPLNAALPWFGESVGVQLQGGMMWFCGAGLRAEGTEQQLLDFLDAAAADDSLHVRSFSFIGDRARTMELEFSLDVYAYQPLD